MKDFGHIGARVLAQDSSDWASVKLESGEVLTMCNNLRKMMHKLEIIMSQPRTPQFGAILFRASELIGRQGARVFEDLGVEIHAGKISIVLTLHRDGPLTSTELSRRIGHSRQVVESRLKSSVADGFFVSIVDPKDSRRRVYDFSDEARPVVERVVAIMVDFEQVYEALWQETGVDLEAGLRAMERALEKESLTERLCKEFPMYKDQLRVDDNVA